MPNSQHYFRLGRTEHEFSEAPDVNDHASKILAWLAAVLQAEHLNLLIGSGFTRAVAGIAGVTAAGMDSVTFAPEGSDQVAVAAEESAKRLGRDAMNLEDQLRAALHLLGGLEIEDSSRAEEW